ncbi:MAG: DUF3833 family protein [Acidobacteriota bacterium]
MRVFALLVMILCISVVSVFSQASDRSPEFTLRNGFSGLSEGNGALKMFFGSERIFHVESQGFDQPDGIFRLEQTVTFKGKPSQHRTWLLKSTGQAHYAGSLSDAAGSVSGSSKGSRLQLHYRASGPFIMHQTLVLMPDGKTIDNVGKITFLGITVGHLHETITRKD